jgi:hypothetical protein
MVTGFEVAPIGGNQTNPIFDATLFHCIDQAPAGNFTVPSSVPQQLPAVLR